MKGGRGNNEKFSACKRAVNYKASRKPPTTNPRIAHDACTPILLNSEFWISSYKLKRGGSNARLLFFLGGGGEN